MSESKWLVGIGLVLAGAVSLAQAQPDQQKIAGAMKQNQEALRHYAWQSRVSVEVDGEQKKVDLYQMRYAMDGQLEKTSMGGESEQKKVRGPIRKRAAAKKKSEVGEFAAAVKKQLEAYMTPSSMEKALSNAYSKKGAGTLSLQAQNVVAEGDVVEFEMIEATRQPVSLQVKTTVDGSAVELSLTFQKLDDGPNYPARSIINTKRDKKKLTITTENFSYVKQAG